MKYVNMKKVSIKVRLKDSTENSGYRWVTIIPGREVELNIPKVLALKKGLSLTVEKVLPDEASRKEKIVLKKDTMTKVIDKELDVEKDLKEKRKYLETIKNIKGIGEETANDIMKLYPTRKSLEDAIKKKDSLPLRNDVCKKLKKKFR